jgi:aspartate 1-decarboxylase
VLRELLKSKIHRATVTDANLHYEGSITIDRDLMDAAHLVEYEKVGILDINNGARFETYVIEGHRGSGEICLNGAAARMVQKGDLVIIVTYCTLNDEEVARHKPRVVFVNEKNQVVPEGHLKAVVA